MKKILLIVMLLVISYCGFAQTGSLTIYNNTSCWYNVVMFAQSASISSPVGCSDIVSIVFVVPAGSSVTFADPYDFESGYIGGFPVGWSSLPSGWLATYGYTIDPFGPIPPFWSGGTLNYPSDWVWTYAYVQPNCGTCSISGYIGISSCGYSQTFS